MPRPSARQGGSPYRGAVTPQDPGAHPSASKLALALSLVVIALLILAMVLWVFGGGLSDLRQGAEWVALLGSDDGMQRLALITVGAATILAGALFVLMLAFQKDDLQEMPSVLIATAGGILLMVDGAVIVGIGWVAIPFIVEEGFTMDHPFVKTVELLLILRAQLGFLGGSLIGASVAIAAFRSRRDVDMPKGMAGAGIAAGALAVVGGALIILGFGVTFHTIGLTSSVAWAGGRSVVAARIAARGNDQSG